MMTVSDRVLNIIEDHANVTQFLDQLCCAMENPAAGMPNFVPVLHEAMVTDQLCMICEKLKEKTS